MTALDKQIHFIYAKYITIIHGPATSEGLAEAKMYSAVLSSLRKLQEADPEWQKENQKIMAMASVFNILRSRQG